MPMMDIVWDPNKKNFTDNCMCKIDCIMNDTVEWLKKREN